MSNLKRIRESKGMSQSQLAKASGVNVRTIQFYEQGLRDINGASVEVAVRLADALGVGVKKIMEGMMMKWYLIDDCTTKRAAIFDEVLNASDKDDAVRIATAKWEALTEHDRKERDAFFICRAETDEEGCVDWNSMEDIVKIK